jgi:hypothetical protein
MKNILLGMMIASGIILSVRVLADSIPVPYREFKSIAGWEIQKFVDPDNGNVCYLASGTLNAVSISCLK